MNRKSRTYALCRLIAVARRVGLATALLGLSPSAAQTVPIPLPSSNAQNEIKNPDIVQDFMATLPSSDPIPRTYQFISRWNGQIVQSERPEQDAYFRSRQWVTAHRFLTNKWRGNREMKAIINQTASMFRNECTAKRGYLEPHSSELYSLSRERIRPNTSGYTFELCMRNNRQSLGAFLIETNKISFRDRDSHTIITLHPDIVVTQATLERATASRAQYEKEREIAWQRRLVEVRNWQTTIKPGSDTGCGPVLRVNGDMIEVAYFQTREPKWFHRSELWPTRYEEGQLLTCQ